MKKIKNIFLYLLIFFIVFFAIPALCTKRNKTVQTDGQVENEKHEGNSELEKTEYIENSGKEKDTNTSNVSERKDESISNIGEGKDENIANVGQEKDENTSKVVGESDYNYSKYGTIKLLHKVTSKIEEIPIDTYLYGVVSAEMPADYEIEALKAQAVAARTYTIYQISNNKNKHGEADICDDSTCCQAWISKEDRMQKWSEEEKESNWNKIVTAVNSTAGKIITYENKPINAFFHSNSGGVTETVSNVWNGKDLPYLKSVETSGEDGYKQYSSEVKIKKVELVKKIKEEYVDIKINFEDKECIKILNYTESGRVRTVKFGNTEIAGTRVRSLFELKSTNFSIKIDGDDVIFSVIGYGHGVGMSQTGADSMAKAGCNYETILKHFYAGVEILSN